MIKKTSKKKKSITYPVISKFQMETGLTDDIQTLQEKRVGVETQSAQDYLLYFIFLFSFVSMMGSLYYSTYGDPVANILRGQIFPIDSGFAPCELCWFARVLMYPIVFISGVGLIKEDRKFTDYVLPLSTLGIFLEIFHYGLQKFSFPNPFRCTLSVPCSALQVEYFGFVTIPLLALVGFTLITALCVVNWKLNRKK